VELGEGQPGLRIQVPPGEYVMLSLRDTGVGMDEAVLSHLFEPFFTTKEQGKGTGLGAATVYGIVEQSGGTLEVTSRPGAGTTVRVFLPRAGEPCAAAAGEGSAAAARGGETLLLAEDEEQLRDLAARVLEDLGYRVLKACDGEDALRVLRGEAGPVPLLVTDVVMPGMSGLDLADRVCAERPETRVLYISGYTDDAVVRLGALGPGRAYLQKPFSPEALALRVREVLDAADLPGGGP
jgi:CheY-like chemotaxis protein